MDAVFEKMLSLSLQAGIIAAAVTVLRLLLKKAPRKLICCLWALVALRLLVPFSLESRVSLMPDPALPEVLTVTQPAPTVREPVAQEQPEPLPAPLPALPGPAPVEEKEAMDVLTVLEAIWAAGALAMVLYGAVSYGRLRRKVAPALELGKGIWFCDYIQSPFVMGTLKPRIYLPSSIEEKDLPYILAHEQAHIARMDPVWKLVGFLLLTVHWFNPLLWLAFLLFCRDIESACDEKVIAGLGDGARVPYSEALLNCSLPRGRIYPLAFGEIGVKQRIQEVLSYKKPALWVTLTAVLALLVTGVCLLTNRPGRPASEFYRFPDGETLQLSGNFMLYSMSGQEEQAAVEDFLRTVRYDPSPVEKPMDPVSTFTLDLTTGTLMEPKGLFFSPDGSQVAVGAVNAIEAGYEIENPKAVTDFFGAWLQPFANRETVGKPIWQEGAPWVWTKGVEEDRLLKVKLRTWEQENTDPGTSRSTQGGGIYNTKNVNRLLDLLHGLGKANFTPGTDKAMGRDISQPAASGVTCTTVFLYDDIDRRVVVIRQEEDQLDFYVSGFYETALDQDTTALSYRHWELDSPGLLAYMKSLQDASPTLTTFVGWEHDWMMPRELIREPARITLPVLSGWEVVEVPPEGEAPWGFRVRPEEEDGWLFFSHWPKGFSMEEEDRFYSETGRFGFDKAIVSYPASMVSPDGSYDTRDQLWSYQLFQGDLGDYAIVNEGADDWIPEFRDAVEDLCLLTQFQAQLPEDQPKTKAGPDISLWRKTVTYGDLESPALVIQNRHNRTSLTEPVLEPFLSVLRSLPDRDIQDMRYGQRQSLEKLMAPQNEGETNTALVLPIKDQNQVLVLVCRSRADWSRSYLQFYVTEQYDEVLGDPNAKVFYSEYHLEDGLLPGAAEQLLIRAGSPDREKLQMEHGKGRISVELLPSWEYETVPYADGSTPWGFRIRPKGETGWLFVSFCPAGLPGETQEPGNRSVSYNPQYAPFGGSVEEQYSEDDYTADWERKPDAFWEYRLYRCSFGDYVIFNENADTWIPRYRQEVEDTLALLELRGDS